MENKFIKMSLIVAIGFLFVVPTLFPIAIGYDIETEDIELADVSLDETVAEKLTAPGDGLMDSAWPMYSHDARHTGRSPNAPSGKYGIEKWRIVIDDGIVKSSPAIDENGTIYVGSSIEHSLFAIYSNGTEKWRFKTNGWVESSPALAADGTIYVGADGDEGYIYAIYPNGTLRWKTRVGTGWTYGSPAIDQEGIIYATSVIGSNICAIYPNGTKKWSYRTNGWVYCSPTVDDNGTVYCGSNDGYMYALYSSNGTLKWKYKTSDFIQSAPSIDDDGIIYFGSWDGGLYALNPNGTLKWRCGGFGLIDESSPAIAEDGTIYVGTAGAYINKIFSINPDGTKKWEFDAGEAVYSSPAVDKNGIIYVGSYNGNFYALNPDGSLLWKYATGGQIESSPAIAEDGTIYFVGYNIYQPDFYAHLYALEVKEHAPNLEIGEIKSRFLRLPVEIKNTGDVDANAIDWIIHIYGGIGLIREWTQGSIDIIEAGDTKKVMAWPIFGLGLVRIRITVTAPGSNPDWNERYGTVLGPFIKFRE